MLQNSRLTVEAKKKKLNFTLMLISTNKSNIQQYTKIYPLARQIALSLELYVRPSKMYSISYTIPPVECLARIDLKYIETSKFIRSQQNQNCRSILPFKTTTKRNTCAYSMYIGQHVFVIYYMTQRPCLSHLLHSHYQTCKFENIWCCSK